MLIVEGIDRVGKTTLIKKISEEMNVPVFADSYVIHEGRDCKQANTEKIISVINFAKTVTDLFICDRLHISEQIYGYYDRHYMNEYMCEIENMLKEIDAKVIFVMPTDLMESIKQHGSDLSRHYKAFCSEYEMCELKKFQCDYNTLDEAVKWVKKNGI